MSLQDRIRAYIKHLNVSVSEFETKTGLSNGAVSKMGDGTRRATLDRISKTYPSLNKTWLLTGEGEMLTTDNAPPEEEKSAEHSQLIPAPPGKGIPLIPLPAMAGFLKGEADIDRNDMEWYYVPAFSDCTFLIRVKGDSMTPRYLSGDIVACREVHDTGTFFQWGKAYVLDTDQGVVLKRVRRSELPDHILCVSDNPDYEPFDVPVSSIYHLAIVRGLIREE